MAAENCWNWIVNVWNGACDWFNNTIVKPVGEFFSELWIGIKNTASNAWNRNMQYFF